MENDREDKKPGIIGTVVVSGLILLVLFAFSLSYTQPQEAPGGIEIDFGYTTSGSGSIEAAPSQSSSSPQEVENTKVITNQNSNFTVSSSEENIKENKISEEEKRQKELEQQQNVWESIYNMSSASEGSGTDNGNQGSPDGSPDGSSNGGSGGGVSYSLSGRTGVSLPTPKTTIQEAGRVVVAIVVDRNGKVIRATTTGVRGSTTANARLHQLAIRYALKSKFSVNKNAAIEQKGKIIYNFYLN